MTEEKGIVHCSLHNAAINAKDFVGYLKTLRAKFKKIPLTIFMDNLPVHRAVDVKPWYEQLDMTPMWNVAYSPEFNPIGKCTPQLSNLRHSKL